jgi:hypothetical protein
MGIYLDKFNETISNNQYNRLLKDVNNYKVNGQYQSLDDFKKGIDSIIQDLFQKRITPLLRLFLAIKGNPIDIETYNFMLEKIQDDLEIAFFETNQINTVLKSHQAILKYQTLPNLRHSLADLEAKIRVHEMATNFEQGFDRTLFSNFLGQGGNRLGRSLEAQNLFLDPRTKKTVTSKYDLSLDEVGKYLTLPTSETSYLTLTDIRQIFDNEAISTGVRVNPENSDIHNIIDGTQGTYWNVEYLFEEEIPSSITTKIEIDLGGPQLLNFIEIEPALLAEVVLTDVIVLSPTSIPETITVNQIVKDHRVKISLKKSIATKIQLVFTNENSFSENFQVEESDLSIKDVVNDAVVDLLHLGTENVNTVKFSGKKFQIGFDNIWVGLNRYENMGIFISNPIKVNSPSKGYCITSTESRPGSLLGDVNQIQQVETYSATDIYYGSIEYWLIRELFDVNGNLVSIDTVPILPLKTERIYHERLLLTDNFNSSQVNDAGQLIFYTNETLGNIIVYRNNDSNPLTQVLSTDSDGWMSLTAAESSLTQNVPNSGKPMKFGILITMPKDGDIFTVSYTPITSNISTKEVSESSTNQFLVDLIGDLSARSFTDQLVITSQFKKISEISSVNSYIMVIMRRNCSNDNLSPLTKEFLLAVNLQDAGKIEE